MSKPNLENSLAMGDPTLKIEPGDWVRYTGPDHEYAADRTTDGQPHTVRAGDIFQVVSYNTHNDELYFDVEVIQDKYRVPLVTSKFVELYAKGSDTTIAFEYEGHWRQMITVKGPRASEVMGKLRPALEEALKMFDVDPSDRINSVEEIIECLKRKSAAHEKH